MVIVLHGGGVRDWAAAVAQDEGQRAGRQHQGEVRSHSVSQASAIRISSYLHSPTGTVYDVNCECTYLALPL